LVTSYSSNTVSGYVLLHLVCILVQQPTLNVTVLISPSFTGIPTSVCQNAGSFT
jgi:hypothetical protein